MDTNRHCSACGNCLKACPNDAIGVHLRAPGNEFTSQKIFMRDNALLSIIILGVIGFQAFVMTEAWASFHKRMVVLPFFSNDAILYSIILLVVVCVPLILFFLLLFGQSGLQKNQTLMMFCVLVWLIYHLPY